MNGSSRTTFVRTLVCTLALVLFISLRAFASPLGPFVQIKDGGCFWPTICYNPTSDRYLVLWGDYNDYGSGAPHLRGQIVDADTGEPIVRDFVVSSWPSGPTYIQSVTYNPDNGEWFVLFVIELSGSEGDIYAQRVDANGNQIGSYIPLVTTAGYQSQAHAAYDPASHRYLVTWTDWTPSPLKVHGRLFDQYGSPIGSRVSISDTSPYSKSESRVAYNPVTNEFLVTWTDQRNWNGQGNDNDWVDVYAQRINPVNGTLIGGNVMVCGPTGVPYVGDGLDLGEIIANPADGRYFLAITRLQPTGAPVGGWVALGRVLNSDATPYTSIFNVSYPERGAFTGAVHNPVDNTYIMSYLDANYDLSAKQFSAAGVQIGSVIPVFRTSLYEENFGYLDIRPNDGRLMQVTTWYENLVMHTVPKFVLTQRFKTGSDTYAPSGPISLRAHKQSTTSVKLTWTNPYDLDFAGLIIRRRADTYPTSITDGILVCERTGIPGSSDSFANTIASGETWYYTIFSRDNASPTYNYSASGSAVSSDLWLNETFDNYALGYLDMQGGWNRSDNNTRGCFVQDQVRTGSAGKAVEIMWGPTYSDQANIADFSVITGARQKISFDMRRNAAASTNQSIIEIYGSGAKIARVYWGGGYRMLTGPGDTLTDLVPSPAAGQWYHVEIEADLDGQLLNAWVDSVQKVFSRPFYQATSQIDTISLTGYNVATIPSYLDNLKGERALVPPSAPSVNVPAIGEDVETQYPTISWTGDTHDMLEVHVNTTNSPTDGTSYDSGERTSSLNYWTVGPLAVGQTYYVFVRLHNGDGWGPWSAAGHWFRVTQNSNAPSPPVEFGVMSNNRVLRLTWKNPPEPDFAGVTVRYSTKGYPVSRTDGLLAGTVSGGTPGGAAGYTHLNLTNGIRYYYSVFSYDSSGLYSGAANDFSTPETWTLEYLADYLPSSSTPVWTLYDGGETYCHIEPPGGVLHILDDSTAGGSKVLWSRSWAASDSTGATVIVRAKCDSASPGANSGNITVSNGTCSITFIILPDRVVSKNTGSGLYDRQYLLNGTTYRKYRFTLQNGSYACYVDEALIPVFTGAAYASADNSIIIGVNGSAHTQSLYIDNLCYKTTGAVPPAASISIDILSAKLLGNGQSVTVGGNVVSGAFTDYLYIQDGIRGLRVDKTAHGRAAGHAVDVSGTMQTKPDGERYIQATTVYKTGTGTAAAPFAMAGLALGGAALSYDPVSGAGQRGPDGGTGPNNIGVLIRVFGRVTEVDPLGQYFKIDDGSGPVKVLSGSLAEPVGQPYVAVTGFSALDGGVSPPGRAVRPRTQSDIVEY
ncbi:MAG: hypothetical protein Q7T82_10040 [Armatimonadota bacterium]|nr:hypothetical protein [Armatimonadota bacterium]